MREREETGMNGEAGMKESLSEVVSRGGDRENQRGSRGMIEKDE